MRNFLLICATAVIVSLFALPSMAAEPATLSVLTAKAPDEVAAPIRAVLDDKAVRLANGDQPFFEFWFRKPIPLAKAPASGTLAIDTIPEGSVIGVLQVDTERRDFRDEEIPKGVYIVRLGIQPEDGNHQGVAPTRTFALLIPAAKDVTLEPITHKDLVKVAATINAAKHPSNLNLQPVDEAEASGEFPRLAEHSDGAHKVVLLKLPARIGDSGDGTPLTFALVYEGTGTI